MSNAAPLASVIVVAWNSEDVLGRCLDQLAAQDYPNFEIVVVDDGSRDATIDVARDALGSARLTIVRSPLNRGCPHARNLGLRYAEGEIVAFIDGDGYATPSWLRNVVAEFEDPTVGGVASTVFMESNPLVLNGAGGILNRQGWAADLSMNLSYERSTIPEEALYPMGCGMAIRRTAVDTVGLFDDRMLNYYDDVDYGLRLWRAGYRVVVAPDAWIDHGFGHSTGGDSAQKQLLCEQHRMRVVLKHASKRTIARWAVHEALATRRACWPRRDLKVKAMRWNMRHAPSTLATRWRLRGASRVPDRLLDPSWGENFPVGVPPLTRPRPEDATNSIDMHDPAVGQVLPYGWYPPEEINGRTHRWAGVEAAALVRLEEPARRLRLEYTHVPDDRGGLDVVVRREGRNQPLDPVWSVHLPWQYIERCGENHPVDLPAGDYEILFRAREGWSDPPRETRSLAFALAKASFESSYETPPASVDMASHAVEGQLVRGWFEPEQAGERIYRWGSRHASALVRLDRPVSGACLAYCLPPTFTGGLRLSFRSLKSRRIAASVSIDWADGAWHEDRFDLALDPGEYLVAFDADETWSNRGGQDPAFSAEARALGFAVSSLALVEPPKASARR